MLERVPSSLFRHPGWLAWKEKQGWRRADRDLGFPLLLRDLGEAGSMAYAAGPHPPPGVYPKTPDERGRALEDLSLRLAPILPADCAFIRWDLMTGAWVDDEGRPLDVRLQELRMNASTRGRRLRKAPRETFCLHTMLVDLEGDEMALEAKMASKTRYSVRLAARRGTAVLRADEAGLGRFSALYDQTARRHGLPIQPEAQFRDLFAAAKRHHLGLDLYIAESRSEDVAAAMIAKDKGMAWYLFAASSAEWRDACGPSAILHRALVDCAREGIITIDLLGVAPPGISNHPLSGITHFKSGFGGRRFCRAGAWDFVLRPKEYTAYAQAESLA